MFRGISSDGPIERFARRIARETRLTKRQQDQDTRLASALRESLSTKFLWLAGLLVLLVWIAYAVRFVPAMSFSWIPAFSIPLQEKEMAAWGQFGDFLAGTINPLLSFLALLAVVKSLKLQSVQAAQAHEDRFASDIANRMAALHAASDVLTASIQQDLEVVAQRGPVDPARYKSKLDQREEISAELLRLARQLLDERASVAV